MDFKHYDSNIHKSFTGIGNNIIIDNFEKAFQLHKNLHVRIPLVKGFNDSEKDIINFVHFFRQYKPKNASFEFLPYHEYGKEKWSQCGMNYQLKSGFIEPETLTIYKKVFLNSNLSVVET